MWRSLLKRQKRFRLMLKRCILWWVSKNLWTYPTWNDVFSQSCEFKKCGVKIPENFYTTFLCLILFFYNLILVVESKVRAGRSAFIKPYHFVLVHIHYAHIFFPFFIIVIICTHFALALNGWFFIIFFHGFSYLPAF